MPDSTCEALQEIQAAVRVEGSKRKPHQAFKVVVQVFLVCVLPHRSLELGLGLAGKQRLLSGYQQATETPPPTSTER